MRVSLDVSHVKEGTENLWYTTCSVEFSNEERAVIEERGLSQHELVFEQGYVNYVSPRKTVDPRATSGFALMIFVVGLPMTYFAPPLALLAWIAAPTLYIYGKIRGRSEPSPPQTSVIVGKLLYDGGFSVCAFKDTVKSNAVEQEIRQQLEGLKRLITYSAKPIVSQSFDL